MSENDVQVTPDAGQEAAGGETAVKKSKTAKKTVSQQKVPAEVKESKKPAAIDDVMATIKNMTVLELSQLRILLFLKFLQVQVLDATLIGIHPETG